MSLPSPIVTVTSEDLAGVSPEPTQTLPINIRFRSDTKCSHTNITGFTLASDAMRVTTAAKVREVLQILRVEGEMTLALLTPGVCALPDSLLRYANQFENTTALVIDISPSPTVAIVSVDCAATVTHEKDSDGDGDPNTEVFLYACTTIRPEGEDGPWVAEPGVVYRHEGEELAPDYVKRYKQRADVFAPSKAPTAESRDSRQRQFDQVLAHYSSRDWGKGHVAWNKYVRATLPSFTLGYPLDSFSNYLETGQERRLWCLLTFYTQEDERGMFPYRDFNNLSSRHRVAADNSLLGVGW